MKKMTARILSGLLIGCVFNVFSYASRPSSFTHNTNTSFPNVAPEKSQRCRYWLQLFRPFCHRLHQIWREGHHDLYVSGYAWHNRFTYSAERIRNNHYNELSWGGGFGKGFFDEKSNWHGLYAFAFLDSHRNLEPIAGYAYLKVGRITQSFKAGLGFSVFITARPDICHNIPFPGAVPWAGMFYKKVSLKASYVPGFSRNGNVIYLVGTYSFD